jgi:hypothetical protein
MSGKPSRFATSIAAAALIMTGCSDGSNVAGPDPFASEPGVTLLLTDAPGDFLSAVVTISEIYFQGQDGRIVLLDEPFTTDLLDLRNTYATVVQGVIVPPGSYNQLRAVITGGYIEVEDETGSRIFASSSDYAGLPPGAPVAGQLHMPSWGSSGLKIGMPGGQLEVGEGQTIVLIDFNVNDSFGHEAGRSGRWIMSPRITATDVTFGGFVRARLQLDPGVTLPDLAGQPITLGAVTAGLTPAGGGATRQIDLTDADGDGVYEALFTGLVPGDYLLDFTPPAGLLLTYDPVPPRSVAVLSGQTTEETVTVTAAQLASSVVATLALGSGVTLPSINGAAVTLSQFAARLTPPGGAAPIDVAFTDADNNGVYEATFPDLPAGDYALTIVAPAGVSATFDPVPPIAITLAAGVTDTRSFVITAASGP